MLNFIENNQALASRFSQIGFDNIQYILSYYYYSEEAGTDILDLRFLVCSYQKEKPGKPMGEIVLRFRNVRSLKIASSGVLPHFLPGFIVEDMRDSGNEDISFRILDYENEGLSFYCKKIEFVGF